MFTSREGDEATSPSSVAENAEIDASSSSLEALIATRYIQRGCEREHFTHGKEKCLFADLLLFESGEGDEATSPSFAASNAGIYASSALLEALIAK